jgi:hypothetical protein
MTIMQEDNSNWKCFFGDSAQRSVLVWFVKYGSDHDLPSRRPQSEGSQGGQSETPFGEPLRKAVN